MKKGPKLLARMIMISVALFSAGLFQAQTAPYLYYDELIRESADSIAIKYDCDPTTVEEYWKAICEHQYDIGVPAPVVMAIALNESSFKSQLFANTKNPFGIKASNPWEGPTFAMWHDNETTLFRVYASAEEAVLDFRELVQSRGWYSDALSCPFDDFNCFVQGLKMNSNEPGYALDPNWDENIMRLISDNNLECFCRK